MSNKTISSLPLLITAKVGTRKIAVACKVGEVWVEKTGANFGLAKSYLETQLTKQGVPIPSEWNVVDYGNRQEQKAPATIGEDGLINPRSKEWLPVFKATYQLVSEMYAEQKGQDAWSPRQLRNDVDNRLRTIGFHPAFQPLGNGRAALTLAGITDPMVRAPQAGEGERRKFKSINGFERDSQGRAYFEPNSKARATPIETFNDLDGGMDRKELRTSERRLLGRQAKGQTRTNKNEKRVLPQRAYQAGKALSKAAGDSGKDRQFWYKVGIVAILRVMNEAPHTQYEAQVCERLQESGYDANEFLANGALKLIATALGEASTKAA